MPWPLEYSCTVAASGCARQHGDALQGNVSGGHMMSRGSTQATAEGRLSGGGKEAEAHRWYYPVFSKCR